MEFIHHLIDIFLHLDKHMETVLAQYGAWTYLILFLIIFCETGLVVTPILPGDSLLFAAGTFAGLGSLNFGTLFVLLSAAGILGDTVNYWIGKYFGHRITARPNPRFIKKAHIDKTHEFFERYGGKTIIIARFVPIVRTFAPFVAGLGAMTYSRFFAFNVIGALLWVGICVGGGYFFGGLEIVRRNFSLVILGIIFVSLLPGLIEFIKHRRAARVQQRAVSPAGDS